MKGKQVLIISTTGGVKATHLRKGKKGIDITQVGKAKIDRATDIKWSEDEQKWMVFILEGTESMEHLDLEIWKNYCDAEHACEVLGSGIFAFDKYEDAVAKETEFLNYYRLKQDF